jgi:hypothetical protein
MANLNLSDSSYEALQAKALALNMTPPALLERLIELYVLDQKIPLNLVAIELAIRYIETQSYKLPKKPVENYNHLGILSDCQTLLKGIQTPKSSELLADFNLEVSLDYLTKLLQKQK